MLWCWWCSINYSKIAPLQFLHQLFYQIEPKSVFLDYRRKLVQIRCCKGTGNIMHKCLVDKLYLCNSSYCIFNFIQCKSIINQPGILNKSINKNWQKYIGLFTLKLILITFLQQQNTHINIKFILSLIMSEYSKKINFRKVHLTYPIFLTVLMGWL